MSQPSPVWFIFCVVAAFRWYRTVLVERPGETTYKVLQIRRRQRAHSASTS